MSFEGNSESRLFQPTRLTKLECAQGKVMRFVTCKHYNECLAEAVRQNWHSFTCVGCGCFGRESMADKLVPYAIDGGAQSGTGRKLGRCPAAI